MPKMLNKSTASEDYYEFWIICNSTLFRVRGDERKAEIIDRNYEITFILNYFYFEGAWSSRFN